MPLQKWCIVQLDDLFKKRVYELTDKWTSFINNGLSLESENLTEGAKISNINKMKLFKDDNAIKLSSNTPDEVKAYIRYCIFEQDKEKKYQLLYSPASLKSRTYYSILKNYIDYDYPKFSDEENKIINLYYNYLEERTAIDDDCYNFEIYFNNSNGNNYVAYAWIGMNQDKNFDIRIYDIKQL